MSKLFDGVEDAESERLYAAGALRSESPYSGTELWLLPGGTTGHVTRAEALLWLKRKEGKS